ncbi:required for excision 1-B domain-containing protein isoform X3 [Scyliorhinus torazame]|uniref:required for excision 1-B domain-containing protein isoform X3 n=1 Tax=Scyliorhinus torazame TaxID=75743 RepID=UPI003B5B80CF
MSMSGLNALVRNLYALQEERVEAYQLFDLGHQAYLRSSPNYDFIQYRQLVHEITQAFNRISKEVIQLKDRFHEEYDRPDLSEHVERVQEREREKLELTAQLQLAKQNMLDHPGNETYQEEAQELKQRCCQTCFPGFTVSIKCSGIESMKLCPPAEQTYMFNR